MSPGPFTHAGSALAKRPKTSGRQETICPTCQAGRCKTEPCKATREAALLIRSSVGDPHPLPRRPVCVHSCVERR